LRPDRRAALVSLTDKGTAFATSNRTDHKAFADYLFGDQAPAEVEGFLAMLRHVIDRIQDVNTAPAAGRDPFAGASSVERRGAPPNVTNGLDATARR
jgi:hypothetical protein